MSGVSAIDVAVTTMTKVIHDNTTNHGKKQMSIDGVDGMFYIKQLMSSDMLPCIVEVHYRLLRASLSLSKMTRLKQSHFTLGRGSGKGEGGGTMVENSQEYRLQYWATRSSVGSFARTAHSFACSGLLASLAPSAALAHFAHSLARGAVNN